LKKLASTIDPLWFKDAVIYELHVRAFADSNGDGIGDFPGLLSRLDYLQDLGITCIWLLPFFPSPLRDDGYDIANYVDVNPSYGTLEDFKAVLDAAHARGMQVMIELVINHTSDQHPWFKAARLAPTGSPERDMYVWSQSDQVYKDARIIFTDTEKSNWTWDETARAYYWHRFFSHQPDLNFDNPLVIEEVLKAMRFWLDMGVDALRMDAIPYLVERDGTSCENLPETHAVIKTIRAAIDAEYANRLILAEANQWPADVRPYFGDGDECHMAFHFPLMPRIYMALRQEDRLPITDIMAQTPPIPDGCQWGLFLRNHDELTLEMVTDDERDYMYFAYSADPRMRVNVGIRRRLAPLVDNSRRRIELLNSILLSFPGTPILYYGDEIGMGDNIYLGDRNGVRTPMQWTSDRNAGFSKADPARLYFPVVMDPIYGYQVVNVEAQLSDQSSLLHWTRNMIALRKLFQVFGRGTLTFLNPSNRKVLAYLRDLEREDGSHETVLCVANLSRFAQPASLDLAGFAGYSPVEMLGYVSFPQIEKAPYAITLAPYSFLWLELQAPGTEAEVPPEPVLVEAPSAPTESNELPDLLHVDWPSLLASRYRSVLESALPDWLPRQRWFGAKSRKIEATQIVDWVELPREEVDTFDSTPAAALFFVEVTYSNGPPTLYQVPLALSSGTEAEDLHASFPQSIVTPLPFAARQLLVHDATTLPSFRGALFQLIKNNTSLPIASSLTAASSDAGSLDACASQAFVATEDAGRIPSHLGSAEQSNTSILYGKQFILKLFRHLHSGENPDVEVGRFLTESAHFDHIPPFFGEISITHPGSEKTTIAFLQGLVANQGDGWSWFLGQLTTLFSETALPPAPAEPPSASFLRNDSTAADIPAGAQPMLRAAALLGHRTAEMHLALSSSTALAGFVPEPMGSDDLAQDARRIEGQIASAFEALKTKLVTLDDTTADSAAVLLSRRLDLYARARAIQNSNAGGQRIRIHGDYHLGQTLRIAAPDGTQASKEDGDFVLIDFEGEPARPLEERRRKQSPLKDVAGMLRSFSYVVQAARHPLDTTNHEQSQLLASANIAAWSHVLEAALGSAFLGAYRSVMDSNPPLLPDPQDAQHLLDAYLLEKVLYELLYELNNRPTWLPIPIAGALAL
jgi:maltose alpha-D-glucosyltransferase/alpha-amylase